MIELEVRPYKLKLRDISEGNGWIVGRQDTNKWIVCIRPDEPEAEDEVLKKSESEL